MKKQRISLGLLALLVVYLARTYYPHRSTLPASEASASAKTALSVAQRSQARPALGSAASDEIPGVDDEAWLDPSVRFQESPTADRTPRGAVPIQIGKLRGGVGAERTDLSYHDETMLMRLGLGWGYSNDNGQSQSRSRLTGQYAASVLLNDQVALGAQWWVMPDAQDVTVMGVCYMPEQHLRFKGAVNYLWAERVFEFSGGAQSRSVYQYGAFASGQKVFLEEEQSWLHALGLSAWYTQAHESGPGSDPVWFVSEGAQEYTIYRDLRQLSLGQLLGFSLDTQFALRDNLVLRAALGYEQLGYGAHDGSSSYQRNVYQSMQLDFEPWTACVLGLDYKKGSSETRLSARAEYLGWSLALYQYWGLNAAQGFTGATLAYTLGSSGVPGSLAERMRSRLLDAKQGLLEDAVERPMSLPAVVLAQVDRSQMSNELAVDRSSIPSDASVRVLGDSIVVTLVGEDQIDLTQVIMGSPGGNVELDNSAGVYATILGQDVVISIPAIQNEVDELGSYNFYYYTSSDQRNNAIEVLINADA